MTPQNLRKADLHCHSRASRWKQFDRWAGSRDCYNDPVATYTNAKARGMDFVTLSDHDTIDGCLEVLDRLGPRPDFFISEEVETWFPETRQRIHVNVFGIDERQHQELQRLRPNIRELHAFIAAEGILASVNHMFQNYRAANDPRRYLGELTRMFSVFEVQNGSMSPAHNRLVAEVLERVRSAGHPLALVGGSDAHVGRAVASVHTLAGGDTVDEFLASIRAGRSWAFGDEAGFVALLLAVHEVAARHFLSVLDLRDPSRTLGVRLGHLLVTLVSSPFHLLGGTLTVTSMNYLKQILVERTAGRELLIALGGSDAVAHLEELLIHREIAT